MSKLRISIAIIVLCTGLIVGLMRIRLFPFSDYPLFSYNRNKATTYAIALYYPDGSKEFLSNRMLAPLTRLSLNEAVHATEKNYLPNYNWVTFFLERSAKYKKPFDSIRIEEIKFISTPSDNSEYQVLKTLYRANL